jgi:hypothetical protein
MKNVRKLGWAALLASAAPAAAQPITNPYFPQQAAPVRAAESPPGQYVKYFGSVPPEARPAVYQMPPAGPTHPYFGPMAPSAPPQIAAPLPAVIPEGMPNPYFSGSVKPVGGLGELCEPARLVDGFHSTSSTASNPGGATEAERADADHPSNKHPWLYKLRYGQDPEEPLIWFSAEYLYWHTSGDRVVSPVAATSNTTDIAALLADPRGQAVADNRVQSYGLASGLRIGGGWLHDRCEVATGFEWSAFMLERKGDSVTLASNGAGSPIILRPFVDSNTGQPSVFLVSFPNAAEGSLSVTSSTLLWGGELNGVRRVDAGLWHWDLLAGVRYLDLDENFSITQRTNLIGSGLAGFGGQTVSAPNGLLIQDDIDARSHFVGPQVGARIGRRFHRLTVEVTGKAAMGWSHMTANSSGSTSLLSPGGAAGTGPAPIAGGFLKVPSNSGSQSGDDFAVVPEMGLQLGYDVTKWLRLTAGYQAMYWSRVARPGTQVNWLVNPNQVPTSLTYGAGGDPLPPGLLGRTGLWVNGVTFGVMLKY